MHPSARIPYRHVPIFPYATPLDKRPILGDPYSRILYLSAHGEYHDRHLWMPSGERSIKGHNRSVLNGKWRKPLTGVWITFEGEDGLFIPLPKTFRTV
jgi:hypothetical protein